MQKDRDVDLNVVHMMLTCYLTNLSFPVDLKYEIPEMGRGSGGGKRCCENHCYSYANGNWK